MDNNLIRRNFFKQLHIYRDAIKRELTRDLKFYYGGKFQATVDALWDCDLITRENWIKLTNLCELYLFGKKGSDIIA